MNPSLETVQTVSINENSDAASVLSYLESFTLAQAQNPQQRQLLKTAVQSLKMQMEEDRLQSYIHLPLNVYEAICGTKEPAYPLAAITTLLFLGMDIIDDLADGDHMPYWEGVSVGERNLAAHLLFSTVIPLMFADLPVSAERIVDLQKTLAVGLRTMAAGQWTDLTFRHAEVCSPDDVERSVIEKSGEELALFAKLAAQYAGADGEVVELYTAFGRALGTASQIASDCHDLFQSHPSRDLLNGTRTLPIAYALHRLDGNQRDALVRELREAEVSSENHEVVCERVRKTGALRYSAVVVEMYCEQARTLLNNRKLLQLVNHVSFFQKGGGSDGTGTDPKDD